MSSVFSLSLESDSPIGIRFRKPSQENEMKMTTALLLCTIWCCHVSAAEPAAAAKKGKPNILYINADDLGLMDVGYNSPIFQTPNINRLAKEGMTFTRAYAPAANCAPSRACVFSGQVAARHGVYTVGNSERGSSKARKLIPIKNTSELADKVVTLAEVLQADGYTTIHVGKWHLGPDPTTQGFDVNIGGDHGGSPRGGYFAPFAPEQMTGLPDDLPKGTHRMDAFEAAVVPLIEKNREKPLFIHFSPYLVHTPIQAVPEYVGEYEGKDINARYASMVQKLDEGIGVLLETLDRLKLTDKTLVVFCSDNGGIRAIHAQDPLRAGKGSYYEGGIREPMVMRWPGRIKAGSACAVAVSSIDFYPTFLTAAGIQFSEGKVLDGVSLLPLMTESGTIPDRALYWHFPIYLQAYSKSEDQGRDPLFRTRPGSAMRLGKWKLHEYFEDGGLELYDLEADPGERNNLAQKEPEKLQELKAMLYAWRKKTGSPVPTELNPRYDPNAVSKRKKK